MPTLDRDRLSRSSLGDASNVLLLAPALEVDGDEACGDLLSVEGTGRTDVLHVTLTESPDDRLAAWRRRATGSPANVGVIGVGDTVRSAGTQGDPVLSEDVTVETVSNPADLTRIGIELTRFLSAWEGDGNRIVVCFRSLTALLQYVELERAFRFLHVFTGHMRSAGAVAHYHLDPEAHDDRTVNTLKTVFDAVAEPGDDGWIVRTR